MDEITQLIAAIQWLCRIVVFNQMIRHRDSAVDTESFIQAHHQYIRDGLQTPFNQLRENMHLDTAYVYNQSNIGRVQWLDSEGESLLKGIEGATIQQSSPGVQYRNSHGG